MIPQSCDTVVALGNATSPGQTLFAKNSDRPAAECQPLVQHPRRTHGSDAVVQCQFVTLPQAETTYRHVGSRPYWCWGYEHGFNEHQVVIGNEALHSKLPTASEPKLVGMEILRLGLERARSAAEAVDVMTDLISRYGQGKFANDADVRTYDNGYIVADPREAYVIETAGHEWAVQKVESTIGISNVYSVETNWTALSANAEMFATQNGWWQSADRFNFADAYTNASRSEGSGALRRGRSCAVLRQHAGAIDAHTMLALLGDHADGHTPAAPFQTAIASDVGICRHPNADGTGGCTAASLVADLCADGSRLPVYWCGFYSPCLALFLPIFCAGDLPPILSQGDATPSDDSPWWLFQRLNLAVLQDPVALTPLVRERWDPLQSQLFESAYRMAEQGRQLLDNGQADAAAQRLTSYMAENVDTMLHGVRQLLNEVTQQKVPA